MDEEIEKELEQLKNLRFDGKLDLGLIIPASHSTNIPLPVSLGPNIFISSFRDKY